MPPPPPPYMPPPPVEVDNMDRHSLAHSACSPSPRSLGRTFQYGDQPDYSMVPSGVSPKLLAHECALTIRSDNKYQVHHKNKKHRGPGDNVSHTPTYFELEPDGPYNITTLKGQHYFMDNTKRRSEYREYKNPRSTLVQDQNTL